MIDTTLTFLKDQINQFIRIKTGDSGDKLVLSNLMGPDGSIDHLPANSLILTLIKLEEEKLARSGPPYVEKIDSNYFGFNSGINLNLYLLISSHFGGQSDQYSESLKLLSYVIGFFQVNTLFNRENNPTLDTSLEKLSLEMINSTFETENQMWGMLGAKYMPSVLYKARLITIREEQIRKQIKVIEEVNLDLHG